MKTGVCYECPDRTATCHSECEKFKAYREKKDAERKEREKTWFSDDQFFSFKRENVERYKRKRGIR